MWGRDAALIGVVVSLLVTVGAQGKVIGTTDALILAQTGTLCPEVEAPVCATKDGKRVRYGNQCKAIRDGATNVTPGACDAEK
jgi:hypothetical protein